ncbi:MULTISPECIES: S4 domain-containing protein YaaA [unclassified Gemella]|uniref:S4 domain-containing protein YaaA n=1 Tax=unclassified Gemella TaxID=2624949 RepID=UPI001C05D2A2|nr:MULTISPECIES: S4 domain-containing protein YaaA [unclassified Gemella]MBU0278089.1 S4 domain-containing protein YaaA [Gemella sp. zg-1178]QWQ38385.1 S4 domain-containing protein YaaA [Gemella sp. zg-570]
MKKVFIDGEYITLTQFLKIEDFINSGGEAKFFLANEQVFLNNELENRRGKKLYSGDVVKINDKEFLIE